MKITITEPEHRNINQTLSQLIKRCDIAQKLPSEVLYADEELFKRVFKSFFKIKDLKDNFDVDTITEFLDIARETEQSKPGSSKDSFLDAFLSIFEYAIDRWIAIVPLGFVSWPFEAKNTKKAVKNRHFSIHRAQLDHNALERFVNRRTDPNVKVRQGLVEHQIRQTDGAITGHPLFICELKGSSEVVRRKISLRHSIFVRLFRLYTSKYNAKTMYRSMDHVKVQHYLLLDTKTGELERFPLHSSGDIDAIWASEIFKEYQKAGFLFFYSFLLDSSSRLRNRLLRSLEFFSRAVLDRDATTRFVSLVISLEALFSRSPENPIKAYLAESAAVIEPNPEQRLAIYKILRASYDVRSKVVHSGEYFVSYESAKELERAAASVIFNAMNLIKDIVKESGDEDQFFDRILKSKLGLP